MSITKGKETTPKKAMEEINAKKAHEFLQKEKTERAINCKAEIDAALNKYQCELIGKPIYQPSSQGGFVTVISVDLIPK